MKKVLIIESEIIIRNDLIELLATNGFLPIEAATIDQAITLLKKESPSAILLQLAIPNRHSTEVMSEIHKLYPDLPIIIMTRFSDIPKAVESVKLGAYDFIVLPPKVDRLIFTLNRAIEKLELDRKVTRLNATVESSLEQLLGPSEGIRQVIDKIHQVTWSNLSVVIQGETGTGKSFIANTIHNMSNRAKGPFVKVDIGAIPENLVESELFGHERGAFTGADKKKKGFFEVANGGTIFIDELENMSLYVQSKLLSVVENKEVFPLGSTKGVKVDVRLIVATNRDIKQNVIDKTFREDLYYRLNEYIIFLPPLRDRREDIPYLAKKILRETREELDKPMGEILEETNRILYDYSWPGNIRELKNVIRRATLFSDDGILRPDHIEFLNQDEKSRVMAPTPFELPGVQEPKTTKQESIEYPRYPSITNGFARMYSADPAPQSNPVIIPLKERTSKAIRDVEVNAIKEALNATRGNKTRAAALLKISSRGLFAKIKEYGIR
ncbi:MAG: sigma-54 dependent transcriptional regulator [Spirochaetota bacterium]|nr:sigma-54 dependent transcriptional regulator [Spirochaetota bacterium]